MQLNKDFTRMNLDVQEKTITLKKVKESRDQSQALLQNSYLKKQNQLEDQKAN